MKITLIDTHAHLNASVFKKDLPRVLDQAKAAGITKVIIVGTSLESSRIAKEVAAGYGGTFASVGVHPHHARSIPKLDVLKTQLTGLLKSSPKVVAVGETGLDQEPDQKNSQPTIDQVSLFHLHLQLAQQHNLPVIIHCRRAWSELWQAMDNCQKPHSGQQLKGVFHCWSGSHEDLTRALDLNFYLSFAGNITYPKNGHLQVLAKEVPLEKLLLETDCPYLAPQPKRGKRCEPVDLVITTKFLAQIREVSLEELAKQTSRNAEVLFGLGPN